MDVPIIKQLLLQQDFKINPYNQINPYVMNSSSLVRSITVNNDIPGKDRECVRVVSYNITVDFFDRRDTTVDGHHHWHYRAPFIKDLLQSLEADIICLQELSINQATELEDYLGLKLKYSSVFLSQSPSDLKAGAIAYGKEIVKWKKKCKNIDHPFLLGIFISKTWKIIEANRFWLNENPDDIPKNTDRFITNKGFNNVDTYRAVLYIKIESDTHNTLFVFNSHYPFSGNSETRLKCAELEMAKITEIVGNGNWISAGDRNIIPMADDNELINPEVVYSVFVKYGHDVRDAARHYGISTTFLGFTYDRYQNKIDSISHDFKNNTILDLLFSNRLAKLSFCHHGAIDPVTNSLTSLSQTLTQQQSDGQYFASDHALIGGDYDF